MATATERKFTSLRKRLDQLGYRQSLGLESLPLVEKLFGDLLHTTESLKNAKLQLGKQREQKGVWEQQVEPYRSDNARLVKENCELHQQLIRVKEGSETRLKELKAVLRRLEHESADLKFLNTQYMQRLMAQEKESLAKSEKILELQEKNFQAVVQTPGGRKKQIPFRRQRMEIDSLVPENPTGLRMSEKRAPTSDPYVADLLQLADQRIADLQRELGEKETESKRLEGALQGLRKQVENREGEIGRLNGLLKGGRPPEALAAEGARQSNERMVAHLNIQIDFLQQANRELDAKRQASEAANGELRERAQELSSKNSRICSELLEIGDLVKQMEAEREESEDSLKERIAELETERDQLTGARTSMMQEVHQLEQKNKELFSDNRRMAEMLATSEGESREVADMLERLARERKQLQRQCQQLRENESSLQSKVRDLETAPVGPSPSTNAEIRKLRKERDDLKDAVTNFETQLMEIQVSAKSLSEDRDNFKLLYEQVREEVARLRQQSRIPPGSTAILRRLESERDDAQLELRQLRTECKSLRDRLRANVDGQQHDLATMEDRIAELQLQLDETCKERDELGDHVSSLKEMVKSLEAELQSSTSALATTNAEASRHRSKVAQLRGLVDSSERTRLEQERTVKRQASQTHEARAGMTSLSSKISQLEHELSERDDRIAELRHALTMLDKDHDSLRADADQKDEAMAQLRQQVEEQNEARMRLQSTINQLRLEADGGRDATVQDRRELASLQAQLEATSGELRHLREEREALSQQSGRLKDDLDTMTQENQAIHDELRRAVEEKESMKLKIQDYAQSVLRYEEAIRVKEQEKVDVLESYRALSDEAERLDSTVQQSLGESSNVKMEMAALAQEKAHLEDVIQQQNSEIEQHQVALKAYELQLSNLTHALSKLEAALRQEQEEKKALQADVSATRELCVQVDKTKESLSRQLTSQSIALDQVRGELDDLRAERDLMKQQLDTERGTVESLQTLLSSERKKEFQAHMTGQEREAEIQHVRTQLSRMESDRISLVEQLRSLQSQVVIKEEENQRLTVEVSSEKFQKEQARQQLRTVRTTISPHGLQPPSTLSPSMPPWPCPPKTTPFQPRPPDTEEKDSPKGHTPKSPAIHQQPDSLEGDEVFARERESLASESARLVGELLSSSHSTPSQPHTPRSGSHPHTSRSGSDEEY